ncbi:MAG TPA: hypothetical protein VFK88_08730 [Gallionella sp.]|nr:hypothetical protein [Gallionella sp.]
MVILRLFILLVALLVAVSAVLYLFTRDRRYLDFAWQTLRFTLLLLLLFLLLYLAERYVLMGWQILP